MGQLSQSTQPGKASDNDALLNAAMQILGSSASEVGNLLDELEQDTGGKPRSSNRSRQQVTLAAPAPADIVAHVYGQAITRQEISGPAEGPTELSVRRLNQRILQELLVVYGKSQGIMATPAEIATYQRLTGGAAGKPGAARPAVRPAPGRPALPPADPVAESAVVGWKATRSLYEQYHGRVIIGQGGRQEPVGAFHEFLQEMQKKSAFRIDDAKYEQRLWAYYEQDFGDKIVPPEKVDLSKPWWIKPAAPAGGAGQ